MTVVRVAVPLLKGKRRFHLEKGRPWSVVEHAMLAAVAHESRSVHDLSRRASLPRRLVLETLIRLMRAGWVELIERPDRILFSASHEGLAIVDREELPSVTKRITRWMSFVIDKVTGTMYRSRELPFYEKHILQDRAKRERLVWLESRQIMMYDEPSALVSTLFGDDEKFIALDPAGDRLVDRYALVTVRKGSIEGLPHRAPAELSDLILKAANAAPAAPAGAKSPLYSPSTPRPNAERELPASLQAAFRLNDLILGGEEHQQLFHRMLRNTRYRLIIHSTFISEDKYSIVRSLLYDAARRGVVIDILWGEDEEKTGSRTSSAAASRIRQEIAAAGFSSNLRVHSFSTGSHAKVLVADQGSADSTLAVVGSCNWLSSAFQSFEASIRLRDPRIVACVLNELAELTRGSDGHWTELTNDIVRLSGDVSRQRIPKGPYVEMAIVLGPQHGQYVLRARDTVAKRLFVTSHRLGAATRPAIIVPAIAAVRARGIEANIFYSRPTKPFGAHDAADITLRAGKQGVEIRPIREPRLHAKILAWDDDHLLLTSQNWLSADPSDANPRREIGIYVDGRGAGRRVIEHFQLLRQD